MAIRTATCGMGIRGVALLVFLGILQEISSLRFEVKDSTNSTCILADLSVNFSVGYTSLGKQVQVQFNLPETATLNPLSTCGKENTTTPLLGILFGANHSLNILFARNASRYEVSELIFVYNLSDATIFKNATENGTKEVSTKNTGIGASDNTAYKCLNTHSLSMGNVTVSFHDVKLEAYLKQNNYSQNVTLCSEDVSPTASPTATPVTPTSTPVTPSPPAVGNYTVNGTSGYCLLANMGLQLNISYVKKDGKEGLYVFNIDPKNVTVHGGCTNTSANLSLSSDSVYILFSFAKNASTNKSYLQNVEMNTTMPLDSKDPVFKADNNTLMYLQTTSHKSYRCKSMQTLLITSNFSINTNNLQVQAFDIDENKFGSAVECVNDDNGMLVPIVVGAALAGLVLIVLIAYLIGRKRSHAGYQTI
ncbi:lysosome-associated membrane glycoprotein 1 [Bombina bombina]|uniref:lysosome-associated membrane glycoprotein 1 n=1 Tax=Bombina bombina TaxID=8345 RepID=UPI00235A9FD3|nr:lysosome-associated membrane glycoprotein 1 [Bombina bombina]